MSTMTTVDAVATAGGTTTAGRMTAVDTRPRPGVNGAVGVPGAVYEPGADIRGALGTIRAGTPLSAGRTGRLSRRMKTLLAVVGPGLIVMVGDNDAGAFGTYTQAGQNYGTGLLWTLLLLVPVIYVNQEMVLRLGAVSGVGHAKLILARFGRRWGTLSVVQLLLLNALTLVTEFIGITLAVGHLGMPRVPAVLVAGVVVVATASTGSFARFERIAVLLCVGSLMLLPVYAMVHPPAARMAHDFLVPGIPSQGAAADVVLLIIAIVGTTVAPWQLFFQQSYVADKRITPRFIRYERVDLWMGIVVVVVGAAAMMGFCAAAFAGHPEAGRFTDAGAVSAGLARYAGPAAGAMFAIALLDASIIGAAAVSLSTAYAVGDLLGMRHSLNRRPSEAKGFYAVYIGLVAVAAAVVLLPGSPLGLITVGVQTLAGIVLPSATVFLLLLCNDRAVLGPWANGRVLNALTATVVGALVILSAVLIAAVVFPGLPAAAIAAIAGTGGTIGVIGTAGWLLVRRGRAARSGTTTPRPAAPTGADRDGWRMPQLAGLPAATVSGGRRLVLVALSGYLVVACTLVVVRVVQLVLGG